ncbi:MAG: hypothetical protein AB7J32_02990 [Pseudonocardia sp.]
MTTAHVPAGFCTQCGALAREHHDRLLAVDVDPEELLALLELAVTWHELDYSTTPVLGPDAWADFAACHTWRDPQRAERAFSLALDIAGRAGTRAVRPVTSGRLLALVGR